MGRRDLMLVAYVPVLHQGYYQLFAKYRTIDTFLILGTELIAELDYLRKEIRALDPECAMRAIRSWNLGPMVAVTTPEHLARINRSQKALVMPDEDVCHLVAQKHLANCDIEWENIFLRWDRTNTLKEKEPQPDRAISVTELDRELLHRASTEAGKSSDWWRQVGAVAVLPGEVRLYAHNSHMPTPHTPYVDGDPRNAFHKGENIELGTALHAEKSIVCEAAKLGISVRNGSLYVTTFPCPPCAKAIVAAGFKRVYYSAGYAMLDGESILKASGVEVVHVPL